MIFISDSALKFVLSLKSATVDLEGTLSLVCELNQASGDVAWKHNGRDIRPGGRYSVRTNGPQRILTVTNVKREDEGEYSCECPNDKTSAAISTKGSR